MPIADDVEQLLNSLDDGSEMEKLFAATNGGCCGVVKEACRRWKMRRKMGWCGGVVCENGGGRCGEGLLKMLRGGFVGVVDGGRHGEGVVERLLCQVDWQMFYWRSKKVGVSQWWLEVVA